MKIQDAVLYLNKYDCISSSVKNNEKCAYIHSYRHVEQVEVTDDIKRFVNAVELLAENTREKAPKERLIN